MCKPIHGGRLRQARAGVLPPAQRWVDEHEPGQKRGDPRQPMCHCRTGKSVVPAIRGNHVVGACGLLVANHEARESGVAIFRRTVIDNGTLAAVAKAGRPRECGQVVHDGPVPPSRRPCRRPRRHHRRLSGADRRCPRTNAPTLANPPDTRTRCPGFAYGQPSLSESAFTDPTVSRCTRRHLPVVQVQHRTGPKCRSNIRRLPDRTRTRRPGDKK